MRLEPTPHLSECANVVWDAVVIGAGPAGALAAHQLSKRGLQVLVVEAKRFPRTKVCGGCLNHRGSAALQKAGIEQHLEICGTTKARTLHWIVGRQHARFALPDMRVIDRSTFDDALSREAVRAGATFLDGTQACVQPVAHGNLRTVTLKQTSDHVHVSARVVVAADGLSRSSLKQLHEFRSQVGSHSRIGVGATLPLGARQFPQDEITMIVGRHGYIGLATNRPDRLNLAAALNPSAVAHATIDVVISEMLRDAEIVLPDTCPALDWHGTPPLTSRLNRVATERLFVIGDASGYVEPFSGEGMANALEAALAVSPLAAEAVEKWRPSLTIEWESLHHTLVVNGQATCRQLAWILRQPWAAAAAIGLCRVQPWVARRFINKVS